MSPRHSRGGSALVRLAFLLALGASAPGLVRAAPKLMPPGEGAVHAFIIGIDKYPRLPTLKGAVADANDIDKALEGAGVTDRVKLIDAQATRARVVAEMDRLVARSNRGDLVVISFAGHGTRVPEYAFWKGIEKGGQNEQFMLYGFDTVGAGPQEVIVNKEVKAWLSRLAAKGASVVFVADSCFGGGLTRGGVGDLLGERSQRVIRNVHVPADKNPFRPIQMSPQEARADVSALPTVTFLSGTDETTAVEELRIKDEPTLRGAMSYSFARLVRGADLPQGGAVTRFHAYRFLARNIMQYSDGGQTPVLEPASPSNDSPVFQSVMFRLVGESEAQAAPQPLAGKFARPTRVATVNGDKAPLNGIGKPIAPWEATANPREADLVWDTAGKRLITGTDVIRYDAARGEIAGAIDRTAALAEIRRMAEARPLTLRLREGGKEYTPSQRPNLIAEEVDGRFLVVFNIEATGLVQRLFPEPGANSRVSGALWDAQKFRVIEPFGAEAIVVVSSPKRLEALESWIITNDNKPVAGLVPEILAAALATDPAVRVGVIGLYTKSDK